MTNPSVALKVAGKRRKHRGKHVALTPRFQYLGTPDPMAELIAENKQKAVIYGHPKINYQRTGKSTIPKRNYSVKTKYVIMQPDRS